MGSETEDARQQLVVNLDRVRRRLALRNGFTALASGAATSLLALAAVTALARGAVGPAVVAGAILLGVAHAVAVWRLRGGPDRPDRPDRSTAARLFDRALAPSVAAGPAGSSQSSHVCSRDTVLAGISFAEQPEPHDGFRKAVIKRAADETRSLTADVLVQLWPPGPAPGLAAVSSIGFLLVWFAPLPMANTNEGPMAGHVHLNDERTRHLANQLGRSMEEEVRQILDSVRREGADEPRLAALGGEIKKALADVGNGRLDLEQAADVLRAIEKKARDAASESEANARLGRVIADALESDPTLSSALGPQAGTGPGPGASASGDTKAEAKSLADALAKAARELAGDEHGTPLGDPAGGGPKPGTAASTEGPGPAAQTPARRQLERLSREMEAAADKCRADPEACREQVEKMRERIEQAVREGEQAESRVQGNRRMERAAREAREQMGEATRQESREQQRASAKAGAGAGAKGKAQAQAQAQAKGGQPRPASRQSFERMAAEAAGQPGSPGAESSGAESPSAGSPTSGSGDPGPGAGPEGQTGSGAPAGSPAGVAESRGEPQGPPGRGDQAESPAGIGTQSGNVLGAGNGVGSAPGDDPLGRRMRPEEALGSPIPTEVKLEAGQGSARADVVETSAAKGFASLPYRRVYAAYEAAIEESMDRAHVPPARRHLVKRYFRLIRPRTTQLPPSSRVPSPKLR